MGRQRAVRRPATPLPHQAATPEFPLGDVLSVVGACAVLAWRAAALPASSLWNDWLVVIATWWIFTVLQSKWPGWLHVTLACMAYLLFVFASGQLPILWTSYGWNP